MRKEASDWLEQAKEDFKTAKLNIKIKRYYASVFFSQQAGEKALKALYIEAKRRYPRRKHNMLNLAESLKAPKHVKEACMELNPEYVVTRYPNAAKGIPEKMYSKKSAETHLNHAKVILKWVESLIK
jgi:HEPN domain-containing protein